MNGFVMTTRRRQVPGAGVNGSGLGTPRPACAAGLSPRAVVLSPQCPVLSPGRSVLSPESSVLGPSRRRPWRRSAFSLAELMIAIGILGIGMLMVAATFPVGIEQTRLAAQETVIPLVVNDAAETMKLRLADPTLYGGLGGPAAVSLRQAITNVAASIDTNTGGIITRVSGVIGIVQKDFYDRAQTASLDTWLGSVRDYPSRDGARPNTTASAGAVGASYTWLALSRYTPGSTSQLDLIVLVGRRTALEPMGIILERASDPDPAKVRVRILRASDQNDGSSPGTLAGLLGPGLVVYVHQGIPARPIYGGQITEVNAAAGTLLLSSVDPAAFPLGVEVEIWAVPKDAATGVSPVIGWRVRPIPLN